MFSLGYHLTTSGDSNTRDRGPHVGSRGSGTPGSGTRRPMASVKLHRAAPSGHYRALPGQRRTFEAVLGKYQSNLATAGDQLSDLRYRTGKMRYLWFIPTLSSSSSSPSSISSSWLLSVFLTVFSILTMSTIKYQNRR